MATRMSSRIGALSAVAIFSVAAVCAADRVNAQVSGNVVRIGVLGDQSGVVADIGGPGSVIAARMAVADAGGKAAGAPVEIVVGDHQNKPDVATAIAQRWFDVEGVDAFADLPHTGVVLALRNIADVKKRILMVSGAASVQITGKSCSPYVTHWTDDTYALANGTARVIARTHPGASWFFLTADYSFGYDLERDAAETITALGGKVAGSAKHPLNTADFSSFLLRAQSSGAGIVGLASAGADTINIIKQAKEFGLEQSGARLAALHAFVTDVNGLGLDVAQGLVVTEGFYWDDSDGTRTFAKRFFEIHGRMPSREQAGVYASVRHYLKAVDAAGTDDADAVSAAMKRLPIDRFGTPAQIQANGRVVYDLGVYEVKAPDQSHYPWDYYKKIATISGSEAFRAANASGCELAPSAARATQ
jgi:branched-chain amino acid transport system substrate-binding protein